MCDDLNKKQGAKDGAQAVVLRDYQLYARVC